MSLTREEIEALARNAALATATEAVKRAALEADREIVRELIRDIVAETLRGIGLDTKDQLEAQKDAAFIRELRLTVAQGKRHIYFVLIAAFVSALIAAVVFYVKGGQPS